MFKRKSTSPPTQEVRKSQKMDMKNKFICTNDLCIGDHCVLRQPPLEFLSRGLNNPRRSLTDSKCLLQVKQLLAFGKSMNMVSTMEKELKKTKNPDKVCNALHKFLPDECIPSGWKIDKFLGKGTYGNVFSTSGPNNSMGALKITVDHFDIVHNNDDIMESTEEKEAKLEQQNSNKFHEYGLSPKTNWMCSHSLYDDDMNAKTLYVTHMSRIDGVLEDYLETPRDELELTNIVHGIFGILIRMNSLGFTHGDFHTGNVGYVFLDGISPTPHFQIIDHGFVSTNVSSPVVDVGQFLRSIVDPEISPAMNATNRRIMDKVTREQAKRIFGFDFPIEADDIYEKYIHDRVNILGF